MECTDLLLLMRFDRGATGLRRDRKLLPGILQVTCHGQSGRSVRWLSIDLSLSGKENSQSNRNDPQATSACITVNVYFHDVLLWVPSLTDVPKVRIPVVHRTYRQFGDTLRHL
jgi:hypothetical protein